MTEIILQGVDEPPFRHLDLTLPKARWITVRGRIATGKTRLMEDVVYAECQRRFLATLPPYWQEQLPTPKSPRLQRLTGAMPAILWRGSGFSTGRGSGLSARATIGTLLGWEVIWRGLAATQGVWQCPVHRVPVTTEAEIAWSPAIEGQVVALCLPPLPESCLTEELRELGQRLGMVRLYEEGQGKDGQQCSARLLDIHSNLSPNRHYRIVADVMTAKSPEQVAAAAEQALRGWIAIAAVLERAGETAPPPSLELLAASRDMSATRLSPPMVVQPAGQCPVPGCDFALPAEGFVLEGELVVAGEKFPTLAARRVPTAEDSLDYRAGLALTIADGRALLHGMPEAQLTEGARQVLTQLQAACDLGLGSLSCARPIDELSRSERIRLQLCEPKLCSASDYLIVLFQPSASLDADARQGLRTRLERLCAAGNSLVVVDNDPHLAGAADHVLTMSCAASMQPSLHWQVVTAPHQSLSRLSSNPSPSPGTALPEGYDAYEIEAGGRPALPLPLAGVLGIEGPNGAGKTRWLHAVRATLKERAVSDARDTPTLRLFEPTAAPKAQTMVASLIGIWQPLRSLYGRLPEAKALGLHAKDLLTAEYHCPVCSGKGRVGDEDCTACLGTGLSHRLSGIRYRERSIQELLALTGAQALPVLERVPALKLPLSIVNALPGLAELRLSQRVGQLSSSTVLLLQLAGFLAEGHKRCVIAIEWQDFMHLHPSDAEQLFAALVGLCQDQGRGLVVSCAQRESYHRTDVWHVLTPPSS